MDHDPRRRRCSWCAVSRSVAFFAIRTFQYKGLVSRGLTLRATWIYEERHCPGQLKNPRRADTTGALDFAYCALDKGNKSAWRRLTRGPSRECLGKFYSDPLEKTIDEVLMRFGENQLSYPGKWSKGSNTIFRCIRPVVHQPIANT